MPSALTGTALNEWINLGFAVFERGASAFAAVKAAAAAQGAQADTATLDLILADLDQRIARAKADAAGAPVAPAADPPPFHQDPPLASIPD